MKPEKKVVLTDVSAVKPAPAKEPAAVEKVVKVVDVTSKATSKKEEPQPTVSTDKVAKALKTAVTVADALAKVEKGEHVAVPGGGNLFGRPTRHLTVPPTGEAARFTSEHRNWRSGPAQSNEHVKVLSKTGAAVTAKEFKLLAGAVAVNGVLLEPIVKDMSYLALQTLSTNVHGIHLPDNSFPHSVYSQSSAPGPFDVYQFELNNENVVIILDKDSSFWFAGDTYYHQNANHQQFVTARYSEEVLTKGGAIVLLENSHLKNCGVIGPVCILNGDFSNWDLNNSRYQHSKDIHPRFNFGVTSPDTPVPVTKHPEYRGGSLVNTRVSNSKLGNAYYQNSHINDSTLDFGESHHSTLVRASINNSTIKAKSQVLIIDASLHDSSFNGAQLAMSGFTLDHYNLYLENVFAPTKVCINKFDAADSNFASYNMVRQSPSMVNLYRHSSRDGNLVIKISDDDESLRAAIEEWVQSGGDHRPWHNDNQVVKNGVIAKSIARYAVDTIMARLASIRLLDEVQALTRNTGGQSGYTLYDMVSY